jgi:hypothetical protein
LNHQNQASCKDEQCKNYKVNCPGLCPECYQKPSTKPKIDIFSSQSTQPPPIPIFTTPTSEQRKTSQNKKHQEVRAAQLATAEVKKRERQNQINQTPINPPPITPTPPILPQTPNSNSQNSSGNSNHRHQKSFFCKTREFFINETTAKIAK